MKKHKNIKDFNHLTDNNLRYIVDYRYDTYYACQDGSDCCDGDYCRCGEITDTSVPENAARAYAISSKISRNQGLIEDFRFYCLERMISAILKGNPDCFAVQTCGGYYGEEVNGVSLDWKVVNLINTFVEQLNKHKTKAHYRNLLEQSLTLEYGYILPAISNKEWKYERISIKNIKPGNEEYRSMNADTVSQYEKQYEAKDLSCLCKKVNETEFILVDGYHRFAAANKRGDKNIMVMWCES